MDRKRVAAITLETRSLAVLLAVALLTAGCFLRTPGLLKAANKPPEPGSQPPRRIMANRVERIVRTHMVDGYVDPATVGIWLDAMSEHPDPVLRLLEGLAATSGGDPASHYEYFNREVSPRKNDPSFPASMWGIPPPPLLIENGRVRAGVLADPPEKGNERIVGLELDAERFVANARAIASSLLVLRNLAESDPLSDADVQSYSLSREVLREGIRRGAEGAKAYLQARRWNRRVGRPTTAIVMSGGAANGAFTAGFVWRLTDVLQTCGAASGDKSCPDAGIDLAIGTSTGSVIGVMLDIFSTPGQEQRGRDLLMRNYTCSTAADVYCINDVWVWKLLQDTRGLVRFDRLRGKLNEMLTEAQRDNAMELVTMTVDYQTGDLLAESDQDPADGRTQHDRVDSVLASSVEPVMADPIERPGRPGTFIDGGVRSGTPAMEAIRRGAERVLVIKSASLDSDIQPRQPHALKMLARTIDLFVDQVGTAEIQQATLFAAARRLGEYNICEYRLWEVPVFEAERFCRRESLARPVYRVRPGSARSLERADSAQALMGPVPAFVGPDILEQVARSFRSAWIVRPEGAENATGYGVDPELMRRLFTLGIKTFQARCPEVLRLLDVPEPVRRTQCTSHAGSAALERAKTQMEQCIPKTGEAAQAKPCKS